MNIIITGASKGLGFSITEKFARDKQSHTFFLCARNKNNLEEMATQLQNNHLQHTICTYACDVKNKDAILSFAQYILQQTAAVDILVNNAGQFLPGNLSDEPEGTLETMIEVNLYSAYHLTKALLPSMIKNKSGHIFNVCSIASLGAYKNGSSYSISKFALMGFSKNLREEMKEHNVKVTTVFPGAFLSESWRGSGIDPKRIMEAGDVAEMIYSAAHLSPQACVEDIILRPQLGDV